MLGEEVGYSVHFDYNFNRNGKLTQIKYITDKELLREMTRNPLVLSAVYSLSIAQSVQRHHGGRGARAERRQRHPAGPAEEDHSQASGPAHRDLQRIGPHHCSL